ncbi:helix-turn-helix transcriptional regulator [Enterococcus innesii]|nr:helix-turn-helix transcriptional regulator [Enterococcus innesii]
MGNIIVQVSNNIRALRIEKRMTQEELAKRATCTRATISRVESGKRNPSLPLAKLIARGLDEPIDKVFGSEEEVQ